MNKIKNKIRDKMCEQARNNEIRWYDNGYKEKCEKNKYRNTYKMLISFCVRAFLVFMFFTILESVGSQYPKEIYSSIFRIWDNDLFKFLIQFGAILAIIIILVKPPFLFTSDKNAQRYTDDSWGYSIEIFFQLVRAFFIFMLFEVCYKDIPNFIWILFCNN